MSSLPATTSAGNGLQSKSDINTIPFASFPVDASGRPDLTIHRKTDTHHGATLQILGHAAEYLAESRRYTLSATKTDEEAIHILMRLSREVFDEYAKAAAARTRFHDWVMDQVVRRCA
jgi:hypothetical protein